MINFNLNENCCGCSACYNICPTDAITFQSNNEGFLMPLIDLEKCVDCHKCEKVCPHIHAKEHKEMHLLPSSFYYASDNQEAKAISSSGGAFYEIAKNFLDGGGLVCGCAWNEKLIANHILVEKEEDLKRIQGSKYVQSNMKDCFKEIEKNLINGNKVIFSGTPCQCTGIRLFAISQKLEKNLFTIGLICHGVPSPLAWETYKEWIENKYHDKLIGINFRDKSKKGYKIQYFRHDFEKKGSIYLPTYLPSSQYMEASIVYNLDLRNSCYNCDCKGINDCCDLLVGDWYEKYQGDWELGCSCVSVITEKGKSLSRCLNNTHKLDYSKIVEHNGMIENSIKKNKNRDKFMSIVSNYNCWDLVEKYYPPKYLLKKLLVKTGLYNKLKGK